MKDADFCALFWLFKMYTNFHFGRKSGSVGIDEICFDYVVSCSNNK